MEIVALGKQWTLQLQPNHDLLAALPHAQRRTIEAQGTALFEGHVVGRANSWLRLTQQAGRWSGGFFDGSEFYALEPVRTAYGMKRSGGMLVHGLYRLEDPFLAGLFDDGGVLAPQDQQQDLVAEQDSGLLSNYKNVAFDIPLTIVTDESFNARHAGNVASVVAGRINFLDGIYSAQLGVGIALYHLEQLADDGPLTTNEASQLLPDFRNFMNSGAGSGIPTLGLTHLFTNRSFSVNTVGTAYLGVLCNSNYGYGWNKNLNSDTTSALVVAHEMGHNLDAEHDNSDACPGGTIAGIMNSSINGSQEFSDCSVAAMTPVIAGASCLIANEDLDVVFADRFQ